MISISGVSGVKAGTCKHAVQIQISPRNKVGPIFETLAFVRKSLVGYAPPHAQFEDSWEHLKQLNLTDDDPTGSDSIEILIGVDLYDRVFLDNSRKGAVGQPCARNTHFGWVISGPTSPRVSPSRSIKVMHCTLKRELSKFWEVEELPHQRTLSPDERLCEEHFLANYSRGDNGQYIVRLPFKKGPPIEVGESRVIANRMLATLHRRLNRDPDLKKEYCSFLAE
ncbi:uncharacterized protein LOC105203895 [Solenopsis invicta]|uniref:uncharacterized protein LOC105203895 n=1 Tax=Solenopsis invicta TaxID=13686 RepID=UPI000595860A|nr:uncharacterized protein LOC105203895 [Solenopsis invicta]